MNKPKLLFVYDLKNEHQWADGLWAALNLLSADFEITRYNFSDRERTHEASGSYDLMLGWGGFGSRADTYLQANHSGNGQKIGLCIGGNAFPPTGADNYDILFYETKWYRPQIAFHKNIVHAFGTNTDLYAPSPVPTPILWDYIGVGSLSDWKRWERMTAKTGSRLVIGEYQEDNEQESLRIASDLLRNGVMVSPLLDPFTYAQLLHCARTLYIPASVVGGGERAILEARASGLSVEVEDDNPKLHELLECPIYDQVYYYQQLKKGIMSVL